MTLYDYKCENGHVTTHGYVMGEAPANIKCYCGAEMNRIYGTTAIQPNGSMGDGYFRDRKTGLTSQGHPKNSRWF